MNNNGLFYVEDYGLKEGPFSADDLEERFLIRKQFSVKANVLNNKKAVPISEFFDLSYDDMKMYKLIDESESSDDNVIFGVSNVIAFMQMGYLLTVFMFVISFLCLKIHPILFFISGSVSFSCLIILVFGIYRYTACERENHRLECQRELVKMVKENMSHNGHEHTHHKAS